MCGIAGIFSFEQPVNLNTIAAMTDIISHRGPDGEGHWIDEHQRIALGHRRLSIIDLSASANQPMHAQNRYSIVFNGEIYNYIELKEKLSEAGYHFQTHSDTEVLLALYDQKKEQCLDDLDGMFAFAIWDSVKEELFCARDRFGEKPFHYCFYQNALYFASEMKSFWEIGIPKERNEAMFDYFKRVNLAHDPEKLDHTFYRDTFRLVHGHWMKVQKDGTFTIQKWYDVEWKKQDSTLSFEDACKEFDRLFQLSLTRRFRADVPVGTSLSGGLDSSSIVCNMAKYIGDQNITPKTFSARFKNFKKDEGTYIDMVIEKTGFIPFSTWPSGSEMAADFEKLCFHQEEPFGSSSIYAQYRVQQLAKANDVTVLIDGQGADEVLAGYIPYYYDYLQSLFLTKPFFSRFRIREQHRFIDFHTPHTGLTSLGLKLTNYYEVKGKIRPNRNAKRLNEHLYNNLMCGPLQELLRYADRNSMAHSREVRLPFLFHELVEFCFSLPDEYKLKLGWTKYIMRVTFEDILPEEVCWRKEKVGFEPPQNQWMAEAAVNETWSSYLLKHFEQ